VFCAGNYDFTVTFDYGMVDGAVTTGAWWSEFGPFSEFTRSIHTYAYAWTEDHGAYQVDSDDSGPIGGTCCYHRPTVEHSTGLAGEMRARDRSLTRGS
jgi:hypothetical protein